MARRSEETLHGANDWYDFVNNSSEVIPAGAILRVSSASPHVSQGVTRPALIVDQSDEVGAQYRHAVNSLNRVPVGGYGECCFRGPCYALYDTADGTPGLGQAWGPNTNSWKLRKRIGGFVVDQISTNGQQVQLAVVRFAPWLYCYGKLDGDLAHGGSATASVWDTTGDTTFNVTVYDEDFIGSGDEIVTGARVHMNWSTLDEHWILIGSDTCPTEV